MCSFCILPILLFFLGTAFCLSDFKRRTQLPPPKNLKAHPVMGERRSRAGGGEVTTQRQGKRQGGQRPWGDRGAWRCLKAGNTPLSPLPSQPLLCEAAPETPPLFAFAPATFPFAAHSEQTMLPITRRPLLSLPAAPALSQALYHQAFICTAESRSEGRQAFDRQK